LSNTNDQNNNLIQIKKLKVNESNLTENEKNEQLKNINFKKNPFFHLKHNVFTKKKIFFLFKDKKQFKKSAEKFIKQKKLSIKKPVIYKKKSSLSNQDHLLVKYEQQFMHKDYILENLNIFNKKKRVFFSKIFFNNYKKFTLKKKINFLCKTNTINGFFFKQYILIKKSNAEKYKSDYFNLQYQLNNLYINKLNIKIFNNYKTISKVFNFFH
jgi:hypothetical protein